MTNEQLIKKMKEDMNMRNFSKYTYDSYLGKTRDIMRYYGEKQLEEVTTEELREFLLKYLKEERKLSDRSINYYNSVIRFIYEVALDKLLNKKQLPMRKQKKTVYKVLTKEELSAFFNACDNFKFKTIFMLVYGSGLRIGEVANLRVEDIDSKNMRIFVREGKGNKERYTILPKQSLEMFGAGTTDTTNSIGKRGKVISKKNSNIYNNIMWSNSLSDETGGAVEVARMMYPGHSTLCYGVQWDAVLRWISKDDTNKKYLQDSTGKGNYLDEDDTNNPAITGSNEDYKIKNIYDMAGNVWEWTMETTGKDRKVYRGGNYNFNGNERPISHRISVSPTSYDYYIGFRITLYL